MTKRYMMHFASEKIPEVLDLVNDYLAAIQDKKNPIQDVQVASIEHVGAFYHVWLLNTENG